MAWKKQPLRVRKAVAYKRLAYKAAYAGQTRQAEHYTHIAERLLAEHAREQAYLARIEKVSKS